MEDIATQMKRAWDNAMDRIKPDMRALCYKQCKILYETAISQIETYGITGNLKNSLVVGCYENGVLILVYNAQSRGLRDVTRSTLKRGERYNLPRYWDGGSTYNGTRAYVGRTGSENYMGRERAMHLVSSAKTNKSVPYRFVIGVAVEYAKYAETKSDKNVLTRLHDQLKAAGAEVSRMHNK